MTNESMTILAGSIVVGITLLGFFGFGVHKTQNTQEEITFTVKNTEVIHKNGRSRYLVFTDKEVFENKDAMLLWKFNSSDLQNEFEPGKTCTARVYGWRINILSWYRNIIEAKCQ